MILKKSHFFIAFICLSAIILFAAKFESEDKIVGTWLVGSGQAKVRIEKSGKEFNGKIVWLKEPLEKNGETKKDKNNPNKSRQSDPLLGIKLLKNFVYKGGNQWEEGTIYDPENGKTYSCKITLKDNNTLEVRGFVGFSMFGRTDVWKRQNE